MRVVVGLLVFLIVSSASGLQVDGVPVLGNTRSVSEADIRDAMKAVQGDASKVMVLNADRMHVFCKPADLGWMTVERVRSAHPPNDTTSPRWWTEGRRLDDAQVSEFMRRANELYVFPVLDPRKPHRDDKHLRRVDQQAQRAVVRLLADHRHWYQGGYTLLGAEQEPRNIGLLFRRGRTELVLFFSASFTSSAGFIRGAFNGQNVQDMLGDDPGKKMEQWSHRFAKPELAASQ